LGANGGDAYGTDDGDEEGGDGGFFVVAYANATVTNGCVCDEPGEVW